MSRVIKFRVLDIVNNSYLISHANKGELFHYNKKWVGIDWFLQCSRLENPKRFKIEEYTGFKDTENIDIYEGGEVTGTIRFRKDSDHNIITIKGLVEFHSPTGQYLVRYAVDGFEATIAINGIYDIKIIL